MYHPIIRFAFCIVLCATTTATSQQRSRPKSLLKTTSTEHEGLTEPARTIQLAAPETGLIMEIGVKEGQRVTKDQVLARLDDLVLRAALAVAKAQKDSRGQLGIAEAELRLRTTRYQKLMQLLDKGHATEEEVTLAKSEKEVALAKVTQAREAVRVKELEYERALAQIERRLIRSPINGVVTDVYREPYEFVSYAEPVVMTVVQLDPIVAVFALPPTYAAGLKSGQEVSVQLASSPTPAVGIVSYVSPVNEAGSQTVKVKVKIANKNGLYRSGDKCTLGNKTPKQLSKSRSSKPLNRR